MDKKANFIRLQNRVKSDLFTAQSQEQPIQQVSPQVLEYVQCSSYGELMEGTFQIQGDSRQNKFQEDYQVGKTLGEGAHAVVRQCWQISNPDETYAVKITRNGDPEIMSIMKQTFLNTLKLNNPLICKTYKLYIDTNMECSYLVMEYLPYPSLHELLRKDALSKENKLLIIRQCLEATQYLHHMGLCHRDLKPDNILFDQDSSSIKIIDFGVSKRFITAKQRDLQVSLLWTVTGNMNYQAPELWNGTGYNELIDIWAIGVIAYQMFCHKFPITQENRLELYENAAEMSYLEDQQFKQQEKLIQDLLRRLLQYDPIKRVSAQQALYHPALYQGYPAQQLRQMRQNCKQFTRDDMLLTHKHHTTHSSQAIKYLQHSNQDHIIVIDFKKKCFIDAIHQTDRETSQQLRNRSIHFQQSITSLSHSVSIKTDEVRELFDIVQKCDSRSSLDSIDERARANCSPPIGGTRHSIIFEQIKIRLIIRMKPIASIFTYKITLSQFKLAHKSHFWKPKVSQAIPHYMQQKFRDPFDYPLRTKPEVDADLKNNPPRYKVYAEITYIPDLKGDNLHKNSEIVLYSNMAEMNFTQKQKERFIYLIGPRYKGVDKFKIKVNTFNNPQQNIEKGKEMIYELYLEALRAPKE